MSKLQYRALHTPKLTPITKEQYRKFVLVRKLHTDTLGQHALLSHNHKKYIQKQLPVWSNFLTMRPQSQHIYHYSEQNNNLYIFQLLGEPLSNIARGYSGQEIKEWVERCGSFDLALLELLKFCLRIYVENGVDDLVMECFRVWEGKIWYNWDTWMHGSMEVVKQNNLQIQNYFLSQLELCQLAQKKHPNSIVISHREFLFKIGLMILNLALPEIKIRIYQYCQYQLNHTNIAEKMGLFRIKITNKQLVTLVTKFVNYEIENVEQIWKILQGLRGRGQSPSTGLQHGSAQKSAMKSWQKQNFAGGEPLAHGGHGRRVSAVSRTDVMAFKGASNKKIRLRGKSGNINQSINLSSATIHAPDEQRKKPQIVNFSLKQLFAKQPPDSCIKMLQYLGLSQHISESLYEKSIIKSLEEVRVKSDWSYKTYSNGSIYLGNLTDDKRTGKGVYLFDSEDLYVGDWMDNCIHGFGTYVFRSGEMYEGELRKGLKHGFGRFTYKDGRIYEGHWQDNLKCGFGSVIFPNDMKFLGFFSKGNQTYGLFTKINGGQLTQFQGNLQNYNWQANTFNNFELSTQSIRSKLKYSKTQSYIPCIKDQSSKYFGDSMANEPNGYGIKQNQQQIYEGHWRNGKPEGHGKLTVKNKFQVEGEWQDGLMCWYKLK